MKWNEDRRKLAALSKVAIGLDASIDTTEQSAEGFARNESESSVKAGADEAKKGLDPRLTRSYVFMPVPEQALDAKGPMDSGNDAAAQRVGKVISGAADRKEPFTDIVVMSHGWHRNVFGALSAYDRLTSVFLDMNIRGQLDPLSRGTRMVDGKVVPNFNPLLVGIHFHSDPGLDQFVDYSGRRDRESFLRNVCDRITPKGIMTPGAMTSEFEELFDLFSRVAAPGVDPFSKGMGQKAASLSGLAGKYALAGAPAGILATPEEVLTVAWACYHEADTVVQTEEQTDRPGSSITFGQWGQRLIKLIVTVLTMAGLLGGLVKGTVGGALTGAIHAYTIWIQRIFPTWSNGLAWLALGVTGYVLFWVSLFAFVAGAKGRNGNGLDRDSRAKRQNSGTKMLGTILYLPLQIVHIAPLLAWCLITPFLASGFGVSVAAATGFGWTLSLTWAEISSRWWLAAGWGAFYGLLALGIYSFGKAGYLSERLYTDKNQRMQLETVHGYWAWPGIVKRGLVWLARAPINVAKGAARPDQAWTMAWTAIENQIAFWDMADKAVRAGGWVGDFLEKVSQQPDASNLRIHLFGHSHGGLVVCNAAGWLTRNCNPRRADPHPEGPNAAEVETLATINGAYRSDWLMGQSKVVDGVTGCLASVFSARDVANSLWYPLANIGRKSSGSVGFYVHDRPASFVGEPLPSISLADAKLDGQGVPDLVDRVSLTGGNPRQTKILNIDASRFVFRGPALPQGAHGDVYSKDVVATLWRVMQYADWRRQHNPPIPVSGLAAARGVGEGDAENRVRDRMGRGTPS